MNQIKLQFDFSDARLPFATDQPICFSHPTKIIEAQRIDEVLPALQQVQQEVDEGRYAAGYLSYEAAPAFQEIYQVKEKGELPLLWFGIFDQPHVGEELFPSEEKFQISNWEPAISQTKYESQIDAIRQAIQQGITYQVNYTMRLQATFEGDDFAYYHRLKEAQKADYAAYLNTGQYRILSASPELFFYWDGNQILTRPMKGTIQRGLTQKQDQQYYQQLQQSEKDRAENRMIVDLMRNDLSRVAETGTVQVDSLFDIEVYPTVFQMTSTITAKTQPQKQLVDIFTALFPCGSITGAPKRSTMQLIAELEQTPRQVYCGAIGFITPQSEAIFNVPIRTLMIDHQTGEANYGAGGGVTWDSTSQGEYQEAITKSRFLHPSESASDFSLLESLLLTQGKWHLLERHLTRLRDAAAYFAFPFSWDEIIQRLDALAKQHPSGEYKVRLLLHRSGEIQTETGLLHPLLQPCLVRLSSQPIDRTNRFLYHKTTVRTLFDQQKQAHPDVFDVLMMNQQGELTEFTIGNLVLEMAGQKWTPPIESGLLPGTFRAELLTKGEISERVLTQKDLENSERIWLVNSVRGWVPVTLIR